MTMLGQVHRSGNFWFYVRGIEVRGRVWKGDNGGWLGKRDTDTDSVAASTRREVLMALLAPTPKGA